MAGDARDGVVDGAPRLAVAPRRRLRRRQRLRRGAACALRLLRRRLPCERSNSGLVGACCRVSWPASACVCSGTPGKQPASWLQKTSALNLELRPEVHGSTGTRASGKQHWNHQKNLLSTVVSSSCDRPANSAAPPLRRGDARDGGVCPLTCMHLVKAVNSLAQSLWCPLLSEGALVLTFGKAQ